MSFREGPAWVVAVEGAGGVVVGQKNLADKIRFEARPCS